MKLLLSVSIIAGLLPLSEAKLTISHDQFSLFDRRDGSDWTRKRESDSHPVSVLLLPFRDIL